MLEYQWKQSVSTRKAPARNPIRVCEFTKIIWNGSQPNCNSDQRGMHFPPFFSSSHSIHSSLLAKSFFSYRSYFVAAGLFFCLFVLSFRSVSAITWSSFYLSIYHRLRIPGPFPWLFFDPYLYCFGPSFSLLRVPKKSLIGNHYDILESPWQKM